MSAWGEILGEAGEGGGAGLGGREESRGHDLPRGTGYPSTFILESGAPQRGQARWAPAQVLVAWGVKGGAAESGGKGSGSQEQSQKTLHVWGTRALGLKTNSFTGRASWAGAFLHREPRRAEQGTGSWRAPPGLQGVTEEA